MHKGEEVRKRRNFADLMEQNYSQMLKFQKKYPQIDLNNKDRNGVMLWAKILTFGYKNKLKSFAASANEFFKKRG